LGAKGFQVEELYGLDKAFVTDLEPIYGFIFLFKWDSAIESKRKKQSIQPTEIPPEVFFAHQTVQNACATQALLSILLNVPSTADVELGADLLNFRSFAKDLTPKFRGESIGANELLRKVHNGFARPELAMVEDKKRDSTGKEEDPFHFVSILPIGEELYEFDGLKPAPIAHGRCGESWVEKALNVIGEKIAEIQQAGAGEIRFNLMAVIKDRTTLYREQIDQQIRLICQLEDSLRLKPAVDSNDPRQNQIESLLAQNADLEGRLEEEQLKMVQQQRDNARRRHNFVPLAMALLKEMSKNGALDKFLS
jgi:ubiquitin carboxyl-terminal hydrolase L5